MSILKTAKMEFHANLAIPFVDSKSVATKKTMPKTGMVNLFVHDGK